MALIRYNGKNILYFNFTRKFFPGINEVTESELIALQSHPLFKKRFETGVLELVDKQKKKNGLKNEIKLIKEINDIELVKKMLLDESRAEIVAALKDQIVELTPTQKDEEEEINGDI